MLTCCVHFEYTPSPCVALFGYMGTPTERQEGKAYREVLDGW